MKKLLLLISNLIFFFTLVSIAFAQGNQTVTNGQPVNAVSFTGAGCIFDWTNDKPGIGLPANGIGDIASFTAVNNGGSPVIANITATPHSAGYAYIANWGDGISPGTVSVINTLTNTLVTTITVGRSPYGVTLSPDESKVYVTNQASNTVSVISTATNTVVATIGVGTNPYNVIVSHDGTRVYVANSGSNNVSVINVTNNTVLTTFSAGSQPLGVLLSPDDSKLYVTNGISQRVYVINTSNNALITTISSVQTPDNLAISPDGSRLYVTNLNGSSISVINTLTNAVISTIPVGISPEGIIISQDGSKIYVVFRLLDKVLVINTATNATIATIPTGSVPGGIAMSPHDDLIYVTNTNANTVSVINTATNTVIATFPVGTKPYSYGKFVTSGTGCNSTPVNFTIQINPTAATPTITVGTATGDIFACAGSASATPDIQQFKVSGSGLTANITATAPTGFEVSLSAGSGYSSSVTLAQSGGIVSNISIYVRSAASASGNISGNVTLVSPGATIQNVPVKGAINPLPTVNAVANQIRLNGQPTAAINFTGTTNIFKWVNDTPTIGLAANGTGNIASFTATNTGSTPVTATIKVTPLPKGYAYVTNNTSGRVSVINLATNAIIATIPAGTNPFGVTVSKDGSRIYVASQNPNKVIVINATTNTVITSIPIAAGVISGVAVSPDGSRVYVTNQSSNNVSVINTTTNSVITTIPVDAKPIGITVSPDGSKIYVANYDAGSISVIDAITNTVAITIPVDTGPFGIVISPDGSKIYVANELNDEITIINTASDIIISTVSVGAGPYGIAISPDGKWVYTTNFISNSVSVINTSTEAVVSTIPVGTNPFGISVSADGDLVYTSNTASGNISVINTATNTVTNTITVGNGQISFGNFITPATGCSGAPVSFTIKVNPTAVAAITASAVTGSISACAGAASSSTQQFTVSGSGLSANIVATAQTNFEVSLSAGSGYGNSVTIPQSGGIVSSVVVYVRSAASAPTGNITGIVTLTSIGVSNQSVIVKGIVNAPPTVNAIANQTKTKGQPTDPVSFTGTGNTFTWINDMPGIGLAASGNGDIASFTAVNNGTTPVKATITVTPVSSLFAYVACESNNTLTIINTTLNQNIAEIAVGNDPLAVAVSPDGKWVYVTNGGSNSVSVINTATKTEAYRIPVGSSPFGTAISPDGNKLYVVNQNDGTVSVVNTQTKLSITIPVGSGPYNVALSPDGSRAYVTNHNDGTVSVINTLTNTVSIILVGGNPDGIAVSPDGSRVYVTIRGTNTVSVINTANNQVIKTIIVGLQPNGICFSPDGSKVYVANVDDNTISVISATNYQVSTISGGTLALPYNVVVSPDGNSLYVPNVGNNMISVINTATNTESTSIQANGPYAIGNFITGGTGCTGTPTTFTITVNPTALPPTITAGAATGNILACAGTASSSPNIQQFTVSGNRLSANIIATVSTGFEVSLSAGSGYGSSVTVTQTGGVVTNAIVYVRASSSAAVGSISGSITLTSAGATSQSVAVSGVINALPTVNTVADQTKTNGQPTDVVSFTGTGNTFTWTNDNPSIGLAASGTGDIASFTAVNTGTIPVKATITATSHSVGYAYIPNFGDGISPGTVTVINTQTNTPVTTIAEGGLGPYGVTISPDESKVYITNQVSYTVSVISTVTNTVVATIGVGANPIATAASHDGTRLYVTNSGSKSISVINATSNTPITTFPLGSSPRDLLISPDDSKIYVADDVLSKIFVINTSNNTVITTINTGQKPNNFAISPDGSRLYVTNLYSSTISVINTATNNVINTIPLTSSAQGITISPDGSRIYAGDSFSNNVFVINTATNAIISTILVGSAPGGISISPYGDKVYVTDINTNEVSVINTATNTVTGTFPVGHTPYSFGNFVTSGAGCSSTPVNFTITVNPTVLPPTITSGAVTGNISACVGSASSSPDIQQFTVSGSGLSANIIATAPTGFEVSLSAISGYSNNVTITQTSGVVTNTIVYVRASASAPVGNISGNITLTSMGSTSQSAVVSGVVNALPTVNAVTDQTKTNGQPTDAVSFTGTGSAFNWINDTPGIGLATNGTGDIASFTAVNTGTTFVKATITITPEGANCPGVPTTFTITVKPSALSGITATGTLASVNTTYGTASASTSFTLSGANMTAGILVTPPPGFEVSTDNVNFSPSVTVGAAGTIASTTIYVRLTSTAAVKSYSGNIVLSGTGAGPVNVATANSIVSPAQLVIMANDAHKTYGQALNDNTGSIAFTVTGLKNSETVGSVTLAYGSGASAASAAGTYLNSISASAPTGGTFSASNYTITYNKGNTIVDKALLTVIADNKTKTYGAENPVLTATYQGFVNNDDQTQLTVEPLLTTAATATSPVGQYPIIVSGGLSFNYTFIPVNGILTIESSIVIPNAFTPNGDGINDTWNIKNLDTYANCTVNIFTRYGQKVYSSIGYGVSWDGKYNGADLPVSTYYYIIDLKNGLKVISGSVTIIR